MARPRCAVGGAALRAAVMARPDGGWRRAGHRAVDLRRRLVDRYRRLRDRPPVGRPASRAALEPGEDLDGADRRGGLCGAGRMGHSGDPRHLGGTAAGAGERGACDCRAVRRSCGVRGQAKVRCEGLEWPHSWAWRPARPARRPSGRDPGSGAADPDRWRQRADMAMTGSIQADERNVSKSAEQPRRVTILGSTGSIGQSTVDLLLRNRDAFTVEALTANHNAALLAEQARLLGARFAAIADPVDYPALKDALSGSGIETACGRSAVVEAAERPADWMMAGT